MESIKSLLNKAKATRLTGVWLIAIAGAGLGAMFIFLAIGVFLFIPGGSLSARLTTLPGLFLRGLLLGYASFSLLARSEKARKVGVVFAAGMVAVASMEMLTQISATKSDDATGVRVMLWLVYMVELISPVIYIGLFTYAHHQLLAPLQKRLGKQWIVLILLLVPFIYQTSSIAIDPPTDAIVAETMAFLKRTEALPIPEPGRLVSAGEGSYMVMKSYWYLKLPLCLSVLAYLRRPGVKATFAPQSVAALP